MYAELGRPAALIKALRGSSYSGECWAMLARRELDSALIARAVD